MRIVSVMTGAAPGGAEFAAVELLDALCERGHEAVMLSDRAGIGRDSRVEVRTLELGPKLSGASWAGLAIRWPVLRAKLHRALEAERPYDALMLHYKKEQLLAAALPRRLRPRVIWAEWGPVPYQMRSGPGRLLYARASRTADVVLAISDRTASSTIEAGVDAGKVAVLPNALRTQRHAFTACGRSRVRGHLGIPADAFVVGCTSRFHPKKRLDVVVDAVAMLDDGAHLILAGAGETEGELRQRARGVRGRVHFLPTPGTDSADIFSAFDVCAFCPSPAEGSPTSVVLGMLAGRPCVATAPEGVAGLVSEGCGAIASPAHDAAALAAALAGYRDDPERTRREGALARRAAVERFDAATVAARAEQLLQGAPGGSR